MPHSGDVVLNFRTLRKMVFCYHIEVCPVFLIPLYKYKSRWLPERTLVIISIGIT